MVLLSSYQAASIRISGGEPLVCWVFEMPCPQQHGRQFSLPDMYLPNACRLRRCSICSQSGDNTGTRASRYISQMYTGGERCEIDGSEAGRKRSTEVPAACLAPCASGCTASTVMQSAHPAVRAVCCRSGMINVAAAPTAKSVPTST